jgi:ATP-dependent Clp protease adaptor protein ClpS
MAGPAITAPNIDLEDVVRDEVKPARPWIVIVWDDPINLMTYVTYVFQKLFGYPRARAEELMLQVHLHGKAVVASGPKERCEYDVTRLHAHGLWASMQQD